MTARFFLSTIELLFGCNCGTRPISAVLAFVILIVTATAAYSQKLYVFIPSEYNAVDIEKRFIEKYPHLTVRVFGTVTDFRKSVVIDKPDAIITKPQLAARLDGYTSGLRATVTGSTDEPYLLLSIDKPLSVAETDGKAIGVLDFLGKKEIDTLVTASIKTRPLLTKVKKISDLLPLMTMNMVEAVFVSASQVAYLKQRSKMNFVENRCDCASGIAVLATMHADVELEKAIKTMPAELSRMIGIDGWK